MNGDSERGMPLSWGDRSEAEARGGWPPRGSASRRGLSATSNSTLSAIQSSAKSGLPSCSEGEELLICYQFPASQWKSLRTTNAIERMHAEFRRRVKTEGARHTA